MLTPWFFFKARLFPKPAAGIWISAFYLQFFPNKLVPKLTLSHRFTLGNLILCVKFRIFGLSIILWQRRFSKTTGFLLQYEQCCSRQIWVYLCTKNYTHFASCFLNSRIREAKTDPFFHLNSYPMIILCVLLLILLLFNFDIVKTSWTIFERKTGNNHYCTTAYTTQPGKFQKDATWIRHVN